MCVCVCVCVCVRACVYVSHRYKVPLQSASLCGEPACVYVCKAIITYMFDDLRPKTLTVDT